MPEPVAAEQKQGEQLAEGLQPEKWLLEEYKLLSSHYFFEDEQLFKTVTVYTTINGGLLAFLGSTFFQGGQIPMWVIPLIGLVLCFSWVATLIRIREWRIYIEERIKTIESHLHRQWANESFLPLDIRTAQNWSLLAGRRRWYRLPYLALREVPASVTLMALPLVFFITWLVLLAGGVDGRTVANKICPTPPPERTAGIAAQRH
jgi:hypothetical protein